LHRDMLTLYDSPFSPFAREVPVRVDRDFAVTDSTDVVDHLADCCPTPTAFPGEPKLRAQARRWQRLADTRLDAISHDVSIWTWPSHERPDTAPDGLLQAGRAVVPCSASR